MSKFELAPLPYAFSALEPHIDARTMEIHHDKHHAAYVNNLNKAVEGTPLEGKSLEDLFKNISKAPAAVRNNGGGVYNHNLYWEVMGPGKGGEPKGPLGEAIKSTFGSFDKFKELFSNAGATRFGSGWAWLVASEGKLLITSSPNQDNPLMDLSEVKGYPSCASMCGNMLTIFTTRTDGRIIFQHGGMLSIGTKSRKDLHQRNRLFSRSIPHKFKKIPL